MASTSASLGSNVRELFAEQFGIIEKLSRVISNQNEELKVLRKNYKEVDNNYLKLLCQALL